MFYSFLNVVSKKFSVSTGLRAQTGKVALHIFVTYDNCVPKNFQHSQCPGLKRGSGLRQDKLAYAFFSVRNRLIMSSCWKAPLVARVVVLLLADFTPRALTQL